MGMGMCFERSFPIPNSHLPLYLFICPFQKAHELEGMGKFIINPFQGSFQKHFGQTKGGSIECSRGKAALNKNNKGNGGNFSE